MCVSETGREKVKAMLPFSELSQVKTALMQTQQAEEVLFQRGSSPVEPFDDVRAQAARAALGSVLSMADLLRGGAVYEMRAQSLQGVGTRRRALAGFRVCRCRFADADTGAGGGDLPLYRQRG